MTKRSISLLVGGGMAVIAMGLLFSLSDLQDLVARAERLHWPWISAAAGLALFSYACIAGCQRQLLRVLGHHIPRWTMIRAVTVSTVANRNIRSGGASGIALLSWLFRKRGVPASSVATASLGFVILTNALFACLFVAAALLAVTNPTSQAPDAQSPALGLLLAATVFLLMLGGTLILLLSESLRRGLVNVVGTSLDKIGRLFGKADWGEGVRGFASRLDEALQQLVAKRRATGKAWCWSALRIGASIGCLWCCFEAADARMALPVLVLAYTAGKIAGVLSLVPGGVGFTEGSMVGVAVMFGIPYEAAFLCALLNRAVYHVLPAVLALVFFGPLMRQARTATADATAGAAT